MMSLRVLPDLSRHLNKATALIRRALTNDDEVYAGWQEGP